MTTAVAARRGPQPVRWLLYGALVALALLHQDGWLADDARLVLGLPVSLLYHALYCVAAALLMAGLVRFAWPRHLVDEAGTAEPPPPSPSGGG